MVVKLARIVTASLVLVVLANLRPAVCYGWSPWPFSSEDSQSEASKANRRLPTTRVAQNTTRTQPSTLDKIGTGTKNFFTKIGNTLTGKKSQPKQDMNAPVYPKNPLTMVDKDKSWWPSWLRPEQPRPKNVREYLQETKRPQL